jgi:hypothetical protein
MKWDEISLNLFFARKKYIFYYFLLGLDKFKPIFLIKKVIFDFFFFKKKKLKTVHH